MSSHYIKLTLEEVLEVYCLEVEVEFDATPGEPMVRYYSDGSGYPGSPPEVEVTKVTVLEVTDEYTTKKRDELDDPAYWDKVADEFVEDNFDGWIMDALFEKADEDDSYEPEYEPDYDD